VTGEEPTRMVSCGSMGSVPIRSISPAQYLLPAEVREEVREETKRRGGVVWTHRA
jgi:hypothetical protein